MVFRESPMNPHQYYIIYYYYYYFIIHAIHYYTESTPNLQPCGLPLEVLVHRSTVRRVSRTATHTHHHTILYTHIVLYPDPPAKSEILETGDFRVKTPPFFGWICE
jgi:hypothetical protein